MSKSTYGRDVVRMEKSLTGKEEIFKLKKENLLYTEMEISTKHGCSVLEYAWNGCSNVHFKASSRAIHKTSFTPAVTTNLPLRRAQFQLNKKSPFSCIFN